MGKFTCLAAAVLLFGACGTHLTAQDDAKPDLSGTWHLDTSKSDMQLNRLSDLTMVIAESDGKIKINEDEKLADGKELKLTYNCSTEGQQCKIPETGAQASFWYNGPMLVGMETAKKGGDVTRERLKLSPDSKQLTVEISSLVPQSDKVDKLVLAKQ